MFRHLILTIFAFVAMYNLSNAQITNVKTRINDEQDKVTITYDLARDPKITFYNIKLKITLDGELVTATGLSGDLGGQVTAGLGKKVVWDVTKDLSEISGELKVDVTTDSKPQNAPCRPINAVPAYAGLGTVAASGLGLLIGGLSLENQSGELYDIYKTNLDPESAVYAELSRADHYAEANKKHKTGTALSAGGGAIMVIGGAILVTRLIKIKKYNRDCARKMGFVPNFDLQPTIVSAGGSTPGFGLGLSYKF